MWTWVPAYVAASLTASAGAAPGRTVVGLTAFTVIGLAGVVGCLGAGRLGDRLGRARVAGWAMRVSASCCVLAALVFGLSPWVVAPVLLVWGVSVIADSGLFSSCVADVVDPRYVGHGAHDPDGARVPAHRRDDQRRAVGGRAGRLAAGPCCCSRSARRPGRSPWHASTCCCAAPAGSRPRRPRPGDAVPPDVRAASQRRPATGPDSGPTSPPARLRATWTRFSQARTPCERCASRTESMDGAGAGPSGLRRRGPAMGTAGCGRRAADVSRTAYGGVVQESGAQGPAGASWRSCGGSRVHRRPHRRPHQPRARRGLRHRHRRARPRLRQAGARRRPRALRRRAPGHRLGRRQQRPDLHHPRLAHPRRDPARRPPRRSPAGPAPAPARSAATASTPWPSPRAVRERQPVLDRLAGRPTPPPRPTWERALGGLLDDGELEPEHTPVGILIEPRPPGRGRRDAAEGTGREQLRIRPVVPGRARRLDPHRGLVGVLRRRLLRLRPGVLRRRPPRRPHRHRRRPPPLGARLRLRPDARRDPTSTTSAPAGSRCCAPPTAPACACSPTSPARARWRSRPTRPSSSSRSCAPTTAPSCTRASTCPAGSVGETRLVGQPATGFWLRDGATLVLGALAEPLDGTRQRLLDLGVVEVPEADWARFTVTHLPGLRRKARVREPVGRPRPAGCRPAAARAARHLRAGSPRAPGVGVPLRRGRRGVLVPLASEEPDPMRDRAAERALVDSLLAVEEVAGFDAAVAGRRPRRGGSCPRPGCTGSRRWRSPSCCRVLEEVPDLELTVVGEPATYSEAVDAPAHPGVDVGCRATAPPPTGSTSASR